MRKYSKLYPANGGFPDNYGPFLIGNRKRANLVVGRGYFSIWALYVVHTIYFYVLHHLIVCTLFRTCKCTPILMSTFSIVLYPLIHV